VYNIKEPTTKEIKMKVGDLVVNKYTKEIGLITGEDNEEYVIVDNRWTVPMDHLEVISESR